MALTTQDRQAISNVSGTDPGGGAALRRELLEYNEPSSLAECRCGHQGQEHDGLYGCDVCSCEEFVNAEVARA